MRHGWTLLPFLALGLGAYAEVPDPQALPDVTIPAVIRTYGLHGPIRTDLSIVNRSSNARQVLLQILSIWGGVSNVVPLDVPALSRSNVHDVVAYVYTGQNDVTDEGVLLVRGYVPEAPGDLTAETYYDDGQDGRIGTTLPVFIEGRATGPRVLLSSTLAGNPRLNAFSIQSADPTAFLHVNLEIAVSRPGEAPVLYPCTFWAGQYVSRRLSEFLPQLAEDTLVTFSSDDPSIHVMLTRSDPVSGCPYVVASR